MRCLAYDTSCDRAPTRSTNRPPRRERYGPSGTRISRASPRPEFPQHCFGDDLHSNRSKSSHPPRGDPSMTGTSTDTPWRVRVDANYALNSSVPTVRRCGRNEHSITCMRVNHEPALPRQSMVTGCSLQLRGDAFASRNTAHSGDRRATRISPARCDRVARPSVTHEQRPITIGAARQTVENKKR